jgi:hypothetical protein
MTCSQCSREAMYDVQGHLLCLEHYTMMSNNIRAQQMESIAMINYLSDSIDRTFGLPPRGPRITLPPQTVVNNSPVTNNNINVDRSVVGTINTAQVARIDIAMKNIQNNGSEEVTKAIKALSEAVINNKEVEAIQKNQLIEQLTFLAEQAALPKNQQQTSVIKMVLKAIPATLNTLTSLNTLWVQWGQTIEGFFKHVK